MLYEYLSVVIIICWTGIILGMPRYAPALLGFAWLINRLNYYCYKYGYECLKCLFILFSCTMLCDQMIPDIWFCDFHWHINYLTLIRIYLTLDIWHRHLICYTWHLISGTWYLTPTLDMLYLTPDLWHLISDTCTWYVILDTWSLALVIWHRHWYVTLDTWYLTLDIWHRHLTCYHLTPDTWHLIYDTW